MSNIITSNNIKYQEAYNSWLLKIKSPRTVSTYKEAIKRAALMCDAANVFDFMVMLTSISSQAMIYHQLINAVGYDDKGNEVNYSNSTRNGCISAIRSLAKQMAKNNLLTAKAYEELRETFEQLPSNAKKADYITPEMIQRLYDAIEDNTVGIRFKAMIAVMSHSLRVSEAVSLTMESFKTSDFDHIEVLGKGGKKRDVYLTSAATAMMKSWLNIRGIKSGFIFCLINQDGETVNENVALKRQSVNHYLYRLADKAGIDKKVTPHAFRRSYVSTMLANGVDPFMIQRQTGHRSQAMIDLYDVRPDDELKKIMKNTDNL